MVALINKTEMVEVRNPHSCELPPTMVKAIIQVQLLVIVRDSWWLPTECLSIESCATVAFFIKVVVMVEVSDVPTVRNSGWTSETRRVNH